MSNRRLLTEAIDAIKSNVEQFTAVNAKGHCVVIAGPGSGKTKTLTTAMARVILEDVLEPRGVACITYNHECSVELQDRLSKLGIASDDRIFIGTVHSFALTQVITPYARCLPGLLPDSFRVASYEECDAVKKTAYQKVFKDNGNPIQRWRLAELKRLKDVDRNLPSWRDNNPELADYIEAYESELRRLGLIDFDDMPLLALRMIRDNDWIRDALFAKFPTIFVDEYQDLGHALHELVMHLCIRGNSRLFAVGDIDQSIYSFAGANPALLRHLTTLSNVETITLRFNYRSGATIIQASMSALGEERGYQSVSGAPTGVIRFEPVDGGRDQQAKRIASLIPRIIAKGYLADQIAVLYRKASDGDDVADALKHANIPFIRTDTKALIKRNSPLGRFIESCAKWVAGGWVKSSPSYSKILSQALILIYGRSASDEEHRTTSLQLITFLQSSIDSGENINAWLIRFKKELIVPWAKVYRNTQQEWDSIDRLITATDPAIGEDMTLGLFSGELQNSGRINLSTYHSAKGREFDIVFLYAVNEGEFPDYRDEDNAQSMREARRLFYVGVTRPRKALFLIFKNGKASTFVQEIQQRLSMKGLI